MIQKVHGLPAFYQWLLYNTPNWQLHQWLLYITPNWQLHQWLLYITPNWQSHQWLLYITPNWQLHLEVHATFFQMHILNLPHYHIFGSSYKLVTMTYRETLVIPLSCLHKVIANSWVLSFIFKKV